jgi:hypothetical protein
VHSVCDCPAILISFYIFWLLDCYTIQFTSLLTIFDLHNETVDVLPCFMVASLCDQATQPFVNKKCPTFSCVLNYETIRLSQYQHTFLNFKSYSNEANKSIMLKFIQRSLQ